MRSLRRYALAVVAVIFGLGLQSLVWRWIHPSPFLIGYVPVMLAGWYGGKGPGVAALVLAVLGIDVLFLRPDRIGPAPDADDALALAIFAVGGGLVTYLNERARRALRERDAEIEERKRSALALETAREHLQEAVRELDAFSYSVSHDLRAPLRHITGFAELLGRASETGHGDAKDYLQQIRSAAVRAGVMVDQLLELSRLGRTELRRRRVDVQPIVDEARTAAMRDAGGRSIDWIVGLLPSVEADATLLELVFQNLLSNAVKFTKNVEHPRIEVRGEAQADEVVFSVRDNGAGFDMRYVDKLFGVFQRLHRAEDFEGTGIGLANVRRIILRHGGRTWAEGQPQHGASFYFTLPRGTAGNT